VDPDQVRELMDDEQPVADVRRPPRTATTAALISGWGMLAAILLLPTTRFGYLLYPIAFLAWAPALTSDVSHRAFSNHTA
jgi:hypothetical protein